MSTTTCPSIPDYQTLRKQNLAKIQKYYSELLNDYSGLAGNDMNNTQNQIANYNTQLNTAAKELVNNLNKTLDLIVEQKANLDDNTNLVVANRQRLAQLKKEIKNLTAENEARRQNTLDTQTSTQTMSYWHTGYLWVNILLLIISIGIIISLFL
jgi:predicted phage tail protein